MYGIIICFYCKLGQLIADVFYFFLNFACIRDMVEFENYTPPWGRDIIVLLSFNSLLTLYIFLFTLFKLSIISTKIFARILLLIMSDSLHYFSFNENYTQIVTWMLSKQSFNLISLSLSLLLQARVSYLSNNLLLYEHSLPDSLSLTK